MGFSVIFGGTFDPVHNSHIKMAKSVASREDVDKIVFIPTFLPPHKKLVDIAATSEDRINMCQIATELVRNAEVSDVEILRGGKSFTIDTINRMKSQFPNDNFAILIGGDMLVSFEKWFCFEKIMKAVKIFAIKRPGIDEVEFLSALRKLRELGADIDVVNVATESISSSMVRQLIAQKQDFSRLVPAEIFSYINKCKLYV